MPGGDQRGDRGAGAVHVVDAPAPEPRAVLLLSCRAASRCPPGARLRPARPTAASISITWAVTSALGGSITSPKSQNGTSRTRLWQLSASNAPQPPSELCIASTHATPRSIASVDARGVGMVDREQREHHLGRVVDVGVVGVLELERPAAGRRAGPAHRPVAARADLLGRSASRPRGRAQRRRRAGTPASASAITASAVSQTGALAGLEPPRSRRLRS